MGTTMNKTKPLPSRSSELVEKLTTNPERALKDDSSQGDQHQEGNAPARGDGH